MKDSLDAMMAVMEAAFDPAYGEAWNRRQLGDAMTIPNTFALLAGLNGKVPKSPDAVMGFALSRQAADEEELLLIAVVPQARGKGIGNALMDRLAASARKRGTRRIFLEMREGNRAEKLYLQHGFLPVGRRIAYYRTGNGGPFDAITYARSIV